MVAWQSRIAVATQPVLEAVTDNDQRAAAASDRFGMWQWLRLNRMIVLGHGFERAQEIPAQGRDLPSFGIAQHMTAAEDIDDGNPPGQTLDARVPVGAAGGEDGDVSFE